MAEMVKLLAMRMPMSAEVEADMRKMADALDMPLAELAAAFDRALNTPVAEPLAKTGP